MARFRLQARTLALAFGLCAWGTGVAWGSVVLLRYSETPSEAARPTTGWPAGTRVARSEDHDTLVMVVHPHCPCSRASVNELSKIMTRLSGKLETHVLVLRPAGMTDAWTHSDLWKAAERIPGVQVQEDLDGAEARRFGAATSGQAFLYGRDGRLKFSGGITGARGHEGDNLGEARITSLVLTGNADSAEASVYGCALSDHERGKP